MRLILSPSMSLLRISLSTLIACHLLPHVVSLDQNSCNIKVDTGEVINLGKLARDHVDYFVASESDDQFYINICHPINDDFCKSGSVGCLTSRQNAADKTSWKSLGTLSDSTLELVNGKVVMRIKNGDTCPSNSGRSMSATVEFECLSGAANGTRGDPVFLGQENCEYRFKWATSYACTKDDLAKQPNTPNKPSEAIVTDCTYQSQAVKFDLSPLKRTQEGTNWEVTAPNDDSTYLINVCHPLVPSSQNRCADGTRVCGISSNTAESPRVLGKGGELAVVGDQLTLRYQDGDKCPDGTPRITEIRFTCGSGLGTPKLTEGQAACGRTTFDWESSVGCNLLGGIGAGMIVFWVIFSLTLAYFILHAAYRFKVGYRGAEIIPHLEAFERIWDILCSAAGRIWEWLLDAYVWIESKVRNRGYGQIHL